MKKSKPSKKLRKVTIALSERDYKKLTEYAVTHKATRPMAAKRLLRAQLAEVHLNNSRSSAKNQLGLFDSMQIDIFNNTSKTEDR